MPRSSAGILFVGPTRRIFLMRRSAEVNNPGLWSCPAGRVDPGEKVLDAAMREALEECGYAGPYTFTGKVVDMRRKRDFVCFVASVPREFRPVLNWENDVAGWFSVDALPSPMHPGMRAVLACLVS